MPWEKKPNKWETYYFLVIRLAFLLIMLSLLIMAVLHYGT